MDLADTVAGAVFPDIISFSWVISRTVFGKLKALHVKPFTRKKCEIHSGLMRHHDHIPADVCPPFKGNNPKKIPGLPVCKLKPDTATAVTSSLKSNQFFFFPPQEKFQFLIPVFTGKQVLPVDTSISPEDRIKRLVLKSHFYLKYCFLL